MKTKNERHTDNAVTRAASMGQKMDKMVKNTV